MYFDEALKPEDFSAVRLKLASPDAIMIWSHGEVLKPETLNYRTQKPEKDGLFSERIFGPTKDWECYCGKYKRIRYKGIVCDKCGVEVTRSIVRRERMGHIALAAPVSHIWFLRGVPSKIGLSLDMSVLDLEKVMYFANFIITSVDEDSRKSTSEQIDQEAKSKKKSLEAEYKQVSEDIHLKKTQAMEKAATDTEQKKAADMFDAELANSRTMHDEKMKELAGVVTLAKKELAGLRPLMILSESQYQDLSLKYGHVFEAGIGAEAIRQLLSGVNIEKDITRLEAEAATVAENKKRRIIRRLKLLKNFSKNHLRPEWMVLTVLPVIPPDLRPMVQLDGGRFAASDLNDLYRRVINRNNRLKRLIELNSPEVITRNEKRMLQEAVDALIDNSARHGKTVTAATGQKRQLKSIADMLKGKQGRFRQNLLGKRVDYSGRSVIVVGPHLHLSQCGIPKRMALELFKPFVIAELIKRELVHNVRSANRFIESDRNEVWDILEGITKGAHVLLNRAPTLHRLGIQAFQPVLIEGKAIQLHPMVCTAFNADFDGDQMAVHVPLTEMAKYEAKELMLSAKNLLKPATGTPVVTPSQDIVLGCYYLTNMRSSAHPKIFADSDEAILAQQLGFVTLQDEIVCRVKGKVLHTTTGRIIFNQILPKDWEFRNETFDKKKMSAMVSEHLELVGHEETVTLVDAIMRMSFEYLTKSGISWGMADLHIPKEKPKIIDDAQKQVDEIRDNFETGLLTDEERHARIIEIWDLAKQKIQAVSRTTLDPLGPVFSMIESGARGSWGQTTQMMGMKGLVTNPRGDIIELPVKGSFKEGFDVLEYFISTHGARKGLTDTALRTANAGYLTRRLIDVSQDVVVMEEDCGDTVGTTITREEAESMGEELPMRLLGRVTIDAIKDPKTKKVIIKAGELVTPEHVRKLKNVKLESVHIRSVLSCKTSRGTCTACYGFDLGFNRSVKMGTAVGIIAAQSIGEPGTQLTMRTFHTGGVAGQDITQGLPRVEELFEARPVKRPAFLAEATGKVKVVEGTDEATGAKTLTIILHGIGEESHRISYPKKGEPKVHVADGDKVKKGEKLFTVDKHVTESPVVGKVLIEPDGIVVVETKEKEWEYPIPFGYTLVIKDGAEVERGDRLTEGSIDLHQLYYLKGQLAVQKYIMSEIQNIYSTQGQKLNDKHIEIIVRQMFSRVYIRDAEDTELLSGEIIERSQFDEANAKLGKNAQRALGDVLLLGITKASLAIDSFFSAASFQETARVLIDAAVSGKIDRLRGLKENVIIGKIIPAGTGFGDKKAVPPNSASKEKPAEA